MLYSLVFPIQNLITAIAVGFGVGMNAVIAFYLGTEDHKKAEDSMAQDYYFLQYME